MVEIDRSDPAMRADTAATRLERGQRAHRVLAALALAGAGLAGPVAAEPLTGGPGATVGAIVLSVVCIGTAAVVWPWAWSTREREHHRLAAIWAETRGDAEDVTPWTRYAAWAQAADGRVELVRVTRAGSTADPSPSPFSASVVQTLDADLMVEAASAMERLREDAAARETLAYERHVAAAAAADRRRDDDALRRVEDAAATEQRQAEERMRGELAQQDAAERRAHADALARALRRP